MPLGRNAMGGLTEVSAAMRSNADWQLRRQRRREKTSAIEELQVRVAEEELHERRAVAAALRERMGRHEQQRKLLAEEEEEWRASHRTDSLTRTMAAKTTRRHLEERRLARLREAEARSEEVSRRFLLGKLEEYADRLERRADSGRDGALGPPSPSFFRPTTGPGQTEWLQGISPRWRPPVLFEGLSGPPLTPTTPADTPKTRPKGPTKPPERMPPITIPTPPIVLSSSPLSSRDCRRATGPKDSDLMYTWPQCPTPAFTIPS